MTICGYCRKRDINVEHICLEERKFWEHLCDVYKDKISVIEINFSKVEKENKHLEDLAINLKTQLEEAKDKLHRRNMQIKELKNKISTLLNTPMNAYGETLDTILNKKD